MERDGLSRSEAEVHFSEVKQEVTALVADGFYDYAEYVFEHDLGLELDYIIYMI